MDISTFTTWADNNGLEGFESPKPLPDALSQLYNKGLRFKKVPAFFWNYDGKEPKLSKCCSVYFMVDSVCTSQKILEAFDKAGINIEETCSIRRKNSNRSWVVAFDSASTKEDTLDISSVEINSTSVFSWRLRKSLGPVWITWYYSHWPPVLLRPSFKFSSRPDSRLHWQRSQNGSNATLPSYPFDHHLQDLSWRIACHVLLPFLNF